MAVDLVANPQVGWLTVVHDDSGLEVRSLSVTEDGSVSVTGPAGTKVIGRLTDAMLDDVKSCRRAMVVRMHGERVASAETVHFTNEVG